MKKKAELNDTNFSKMVAKYAASDLPNRWFLQQFESPYSLPFCKKEFWLFFSTVLIKRGIPKVEDSKKEILHWLLGLNGPGSLEVLVFIRRNFNNFRKEIEHEIMNSIVNMTDVGWVETLVFQFVTKDSFLTKEFEKVTKLLDLTNDLEEKMASEVLSLVAFLFDNYAYDSSNPYPVDSPVLGKVFPNQLRLRGLK